MNIRRKKIKQLNNKELSRLIYEHDGITLDVSMSGESLLRESQYLGQNQEATVDSRLVGQNLLAYMREATMTQERLALVTNQDRKAVRGHIRGTRQMRPSTKQTYEAVLSKTLGRKINLDSRP